MRIQLDFRFKYFVSILMIYALGVFQIAKAQKQAPAIDNSQVYTFADEMPEFPGGSQAMMKYLVKNLNYPQSAVEQGIQGKVLLSFVVRTDGSITDARVTRGIKGGCDEEAIRLLSTMPKWKPGKVNGIIVPVQMMLPIIFALQ